jgi:hypothetical protein
MQIQLSEEIEQALAAEAQALGVSVSEVSAQVLARHVSESRSGKSARTPDHTLASYLERMRRQNPNFDTADPFAVDWQAVKAEGRRF